MIMKEFPFYNMIVTTLLYEQYIISFA